MLIANFAFAVHQLQTIQVQSNEITTKAIVYVRPMMSDRVASVIQRVVSTVLKRFENITGLAYASDLHVLLIPSLRSGWLKVAHSMVFIRYDLKNPAGYAR